MKRIKKYIRREWGKMQQIKITFNKKIKSRAREK